MVKKIKTAILASFVLMTLASKAERSNPSLPELSMQLCLGVSAGCIIGTMPPLIHNIGADEGIKQLSADSNYGLFKAGMGAGVGLGFYNWYNVGQSISRRYFNSSRGRYIAVIPALWLLSTNWKNNAVDNQVL